MGLKFLVTPTSFQQPQNDVARKRLEAFADEVVYNELGRPMQPDEIITRLRDVSGYLAGLDFITEEVIQNTPETLKVISRYGVGVDRVDLEACRERGILVTNTPGVNAIAVCELAFGLMLSAVRNIPRLHNAVIHGQWPRSDGVELCGKTLGIVGLGAIGKNLATRAIAFGMKVIAFDIYRNEQFAIDHDITFTPLDELIKVSDFISLHLPLDNKTKHIIGSAQIAAMKQGAIIINTARGGLIDEQAAADGIRSGQLGGIGLDAYEHEPPVDSPLRGLSKVIMTPHTGAHTQESVAKMGMMAVENLIEVITTGSCKYIVR